MNYVKGIKIGGATAAQIPCIPGRGAPTTETEGAVGCLYMDEDTGAMYKCTAVNVGVYTWESLPDGFYHTTREETNITTADEVYALYDALMEDYPDNVVKKEYTVDGFTNYAYEISTGDYSPKGSYATVYGDNPHIKKPKFLVLSGIHGYERKTAFSAYRFIRDVLNGYNIPQAFREGAVISVMPVGTPSAFDAHTRTNANKVDINRDFNSVSPQAETKAIQSWLSENSDAELYVDFHNNGAMNEKVLVIGLPDNSMSNNARKIALRGVDKVIPYWRDVKRYPLKVEANGFSTVIDDKTGKEEEVQKVEERKVIFSYSATKDQEGRSAHYAQSVIGIPGISLETVAFHGDHSEWGGETSTKDSPEAVAMGAEALGNILIEFYENEVNNMAGIDSKLNTLIEQVNSNYHTISSTFKPGVDTNVFSVTCEAGAKMVEIIPEVRPTQRTGEKYPIAYVMATYATQQHTNMVDGGGAKIEYYTGTKFAGGHAPFDNSNGITITTTNELIVFEKDKTYNWTAHYWNE